MPRKQRSRRHCEKRLFVETLEQRCLLDAQLGDLIGLAASGEEQPSEIPRFESAAELEAFLIRDAERRYGDLFGEEAWYPPWPIPMMEDGMVSLATADGVRTDGAGFSDTNIQVAGVDEGDIVKTDGQYLYLTGDRTVTIVDATAPTDLSVASRVEIDGHPIAMYLSEDRLTVISTDFSGGVYPMAMIDVARVDMALWPLPEPPEPETIFTVFDVSSPGEPLLIEQIDIQGTYTDSRMIDDTVFLVSNAGFYLPPPQMVPGPTESGQPPRNLAMPQEPVPDGEAALWMPDWIRPPGQKHFYETAGEYWARVGGQILNLALPDYTSYGPDGQELDSGLLSQSEEIYKPLGPDHDRLVSVTAINVSADDPGIVGSTSAPIDWTSEVYVSHENLYLVSPQFLPSAEGGTSSSIYKFSLDTQGDGISLVATGHVPGRVLDQFSMDEYDGYLRIVTQQGWRATARSDLFVLQQDGDRLDVVGAIEELAPGERLFSVRFVDELAFVVTFGPTGGGWFDPLFTLDLSDPANPQVRGELEIPGFSNYLQLIDGDHLIGLGRNADETTGRSLEPQVSLYDVGDLDDPQLANRLSFAQGGAAWSEAFTDHHAISYFPEYAVLAIPLNTYGPVPDPLVEPADGEASDSLDAPRFQHQSALWLFRIDVLADADKIELLGQIEHESHVRRSLRIGDVLFSISHDTVKAHEILDPDAPLGEVYYGRSARDDHFTVDRNSVDNPMDVLGNDGAFLDRGQWTIVAAVGVPAKGGEIAIADDGRSLLYTPVDGFAGEDSFTYTISNGNGGIDEATVTVEVTWPEDLVRVRVEAVDGTGEVITSVEAGDEFFLNAYVQDLRDRPEGVYSAYVDVMFLGRLVSVGGEISFGDEYENGQSGDANLPGLVDELGAFAVLDATTDGEALLASIPFTSHRPGLAKFALTPADGIGSEVLLNGWRGVVPPVRVAYTGTKIEVVRGWRNAVKPSDVNDDGETTPLDVLALIQDLNHLGSRHLERHQLASGEASEAAHHYLDVNGDGSLSPIDALMVVSELNAAAFAAAATDAIAQGEAIPPLAELVDWAALEGALREDQWTAPLDALDISPDEALDLAHQFLVTADPGALANMVPAEWQRDEIPDLLQQWIEDHPDGLTTDELTTAVNELDTLIEGIDLDEILPGVGKDIDLPQLHESFRDRLFAGFATEIVRDR